MAEAFYLAFEDASCPCYWYDANGTFWKNKTARQRVTDDVRPLLALLVEQKVAGEEAEGNTRLTITALKLRGLEILPHGEGVFAMSPPQTALPMNAFSDSLRGPVSNILSTLPPLAPLLEGDGYKHLESVQENCYHLLRITTNLELYKLAKTKTDGFSVLELGSFVQQIAQETAGTCEVRGISFEARLDGDVLPVFADSRLLGHTVLNILRNSIQFTRDDNSIVLAVARSRKNALLTVRDKGLGIKEEALPRVFEPYFSADPYLDGEERPGLGLGLALAYTAVHAMGGAIAIESRFGEGTTVSLSLPLAEGWQVPLASEGDFQLQNKYAPQYIQLCGFCRLPDL